MKKLKFKLITAVTMLFCISLLNPIHAQDEGYIYGEVETIDGKKYKGQIRWGKEEAFWDDMFNSTKTENPFTRLVDRDDLRKANRDSDDEDNDGNYRWRKKNGGWGNFMVVWEDGDYFARTHTFACRFGDMQTMEVTGREEVAITFKNGEEIEVDGGSNDVGRDIRVLDYELGEIELRWERIDRISFMETPKKLDEKLGEPLYGTVQTTEGDLTGFIIWDNDECLDSDKLDGDSDNGDVSIKFSKIQKIESDRRGAYVTLKSGREMYLDGSNDVNSGNRGIVVKSQDYGRVLVKWRDFKSLTFSEPSSSGPTYNDFKNNEPLSGKVITEDGETFEGLIVYDLDEAWGWEMLDGNDEDMEYNIPFEKVKSVKPKNFSYTTVTLKSGQELLLGDSQDVTDRHDGILIMQDMKDKDPKYISWDNVDEIVFK